MSDIISQVKHYTLRDSLWCG